MLKLKSKVIGFTLLVLLYLKEIGEKIIMKTIKVDVVTRDNQIQLNSDSPIKQFKS